MIQLHKPHRSSSAARSGGMAAAMSRADHLRELASWEIGDLADECLNFGECLYDPELHDGPADRASETAGERAAREQVAAEVCAACPARTACLRYAIRTRPERGVWGGLTRAEVATLADSLSAGKQAA